MTARIKQENLRFLYRHSWLSSVLLVGLSVIASIGLFEQIGVLGVSAVLAATVVFGVVRMRISRAFESVEQDQQQALHWRLAPIAGALCAGVIAGTVLWMLATYLGNLTYLLIMSSLALLGVGASILSLGSVAVLLGYVVPVLLSINMLLLRHDAAFILLVLFALLAATMLLLALYIGSLLRARWRYEWQGYQQALQLADANAESRVLSGELAQAKTQVKGMQLQLDTLYAHMENLGHERLQDVNVALNELRTSKERLQLALEASELSLWDWHVQDNTVHHSNLEHVLGWSEDQISHDLRTLMHPDDVHILQQAMIKHMTEQTSGYVAEYRLQHADGHWIWVEDHGRAVARNAQGRATRILGTRRDISKRKQQDEELRLAAIVFDSSSQGIVILDPEYNVLMVNTACISITGFCRQEVRQSSAFQSLINDFIAQHAQHIQQSLAQLGYWQEELTLAGKDYQPCPVSLHLKAVHDEQGRMTHMIAFFTDLTADRQTQERINYLTQYDELTGLANRALFMQRLQQAVEQARKTNGRLALLHLDLDRFKILNESLGEQAGDEVLRQVSQRLMQVAPTANTIARLSGNEFMLVLDDEPSAARALQLSEATLAQLRRPFVVAGQELLLTASIGIALLPDHAREPEVLLGQAGIAMRQAKHLGGNTYHVYQTELSANTAERLYLEQQLRRALQENQLQPHYQPKLCLAEGRICSVEALARWEHPELGMVSPGQFIPLAEESGLIVEISEFMLRESCLQAKQWQQQGLDVQVSVNLSIHHLRQGNLLALIQQVLAETGLPAHLLELELTESQLLEDVESITVLLTQLKALGVHIAIDDFGTGYSSLSYLKHLPVNSLKLDQSFIRDLPHSAADCAIVRAIIGLAHGLGLSVVAEGVETPAQMDFLQGARCDVIQGYLIGRPVAAAALGEDFAAASQAGSWLPMRPEGGVH